MYVAHTNQGNDHLNKNIYVVTGWNKIRPGSNWVALHDGDWLLSWERLLNYTLLTGDTRATIR